MLDTSELRRREAGPSRSSAFTREWHQLFQPEVANAFEFLADQADLPLLAVIC
jgi:hypothetical protein